jgi:nitroreductase
MNLLLAAAALGYGAQWVTGWPAYDRDALDILGVGLAERLIGFVHIGTPTIRLPDRPRPPLEEIVTSWSDSEPAEAADEAGAS